MVYPLYTATAQSQCHHVRSFCSTCKILSQSYPPKSGESSARANRSVETRAGSLSPSAISSSGTPTGKHELIARDEVDNGVRRSMIKIRRGNRNLLDKMLPPIAMSGSPSSQSEVARSLTQSNYPNYESVKDKIVNEDEGNRIGENSRREHWKDTLRKSYRKTIKSEAHSTRLHDIPQVDPRAKIQFKGFDLQTSLPTIFKTKLAVYRSPLFNLRSIRFNQLPPRKLPPFPFPFPPSVDMQLPHDAEEKDGAGKKYDTRGLYFSILTSKNAVSKLAVERNRSKRRFKAALDFVLNKDEDFAGMDLEKRKLLVNPEYAYVASITAELHDAPFQQIQSDILDGLKYLNKSNPNRGYTGILPQPRYIPRGKVDEIPLTRSSERQSGSDGVI